MFWVVVYWPKEQCCYWFEAYLISTAKIFVANICPRTNFMHIYSQKAHLSLCKWVCRTYSYNMISRASSRAEWGPDAVWGCPTGSGPRHFYCLLMHNFVEAARKHVHNIDASCYGEIQWHHQQLLCIYNYSFIKNKWDIMWEFLRPTWTSLL